MTYATRTGGIVVYLDVIYVRRGDTVAIVRGAVRQWLEGVIPTAAALDELDALAASVFEPQIRPNGDIVYVGYIPARGAR